MKNIGLIFGGRSFEHDVSIKSAVNVYGYLNSERMREEFTVVPVYADTCGGFHRPEESVKILEAGGKAKNVSTESSVGIWDILEKSDLFFPLIHGKNGEDGILQGFLEFSGKKYVGSKTLASAICMDKATSKDIAACHGIKQAKYFYFPVNQALFSDTGKCVNNMRTEGIEFPVFVKPSRTGSSIGISRVENPYGMEEAIKTASRYDDRIIIEEGLIAREIECAVGEINGLVVCSVPGEVEYTSCFYDYEAKYASAETMLRIPAVLNESKISEIRKLSEYLFGLFGLKDFARVDFFMNKEGEIMLNEINTIPGFTDTSMFPLLMENTGYSMEELLYGIVKSYFK